ncbi:MAG TPA: peptidoglycan-binding domain-containing protein [Candidatus Competibacteraceae bacterium]|nr:peptidoglycan-binding domain-containing protein [Candidatus Competibacteraceae bacterium]HRZ04601.1 peptidoglycan-binding domain-containing protein [Candidatus Competibacteraceae bacterium]HSA47139.1 peptidoglycan-binding domain-containing protein [Candidatus Competibacteraceae bacterium]
MASITGSVGQGGTNRYEDVRVVQGALNRFPDAAGGPNPKLDTDGRVGSRTIGAIKKFQGFFFRSHIPDGRVDVGKRSHRKLEAGVTEITFESERLPRHTLIFFGGYALGRVAGRTLTQGTPEYRAYQQILSWNLFKRPIPLDPALSDSMDNDAINAALNHLRYSLNRDRTGSIVVYGFSAGGFNALRLCERIEQERDPRLPRRINLLITIDPCIQDLPGLPPPPNWFQNLKKTAPSIVKRHINYYQPAPNPHEDDDHYHGCPMTGRVEQEPLHAAHDSMPDITLVFLQTKIRQTVSSNVDAWSLE